MKWLAALLFWTQPQPAPVESLCDRCVTSEAGYTLLRQFEGFMPFVYKDAVGKDTIGFGHLMHPGDKFIQPMLPEVADALLKKDVAIAEGGVNRRVIVPLKQTQFDALVSWTFNLGEGALAGSTLLKRVNAARHADVPAEIRKWVYAAGVILKGMVSRREAEATLYAAQS